MRCPAAGERWGAMSFDRGSLRHQGAESSALKNSAPSSLTIFKTSESTSMFDCLTQLGVCAKNTGRSIKYSRPVVRMTELDREEREAIDNGMEGERDYD